MVPFIMSHVSCYFMTLCFEVIPLVFSFHFWSMSKCQVVLNHAIWALASPWKQQDCILIARSQWKYGRSFLIGCCHGNITTASLLVVNSENIRAIFSLAIHLPFFVTLDWVFLYEPNRVMSLLCSVKSQNFPTQRQSRSPGHELKGPIWRCINSSCLLPASPSLTLLQPYWPLSPSHLSPAPKCLLVLSSLPRPSSLDRAPWLLSFFFKCLLEC